MRAALSTFALNQERRDSSVSIEEPGYYLDFRIPPGSENAAELLENRRKHIELLAFQQESPEAEARATVFVPEESKGHFLKKIEQYGAENTPKRRPMGSAENLEASSTSGRPKNENLIARIQSIAAAAVRSLFTDEPSSFPSHGERIWWEVWLRYGQGESFGHLCRRFEIQTQIDKLEFPDREVYLVFGDEATVARLFLNSSAIAELRCAKDTPAIFVDWSNTDQAVWAMNLAGRLLPAVNRGVAVCLLDTGTTRTHPLLDSSLDPSDVHSYDPSWFSGDSKGHGTNMAGTALYGDLMPLLIQSETVQLSHCLESVKILPDQGENEPRLYGAITRESIARAEIGDPDRRRAVCMAVTSKFGSDRGRPSSWSAAVDQLCFADENANRLLLISAGNIRENVSGADYPARNETEPIENPGQAWNAITVGAYTEKTSITDPTFSGWRPVAPEGDLCPTSRTSVVWERQWPIKPEIVLEGGNWASDGDSCDCPDDLGILTTHFNPTVKHFSVFRDTSAATAIGGNLAGRILSAMPQRWAETIRGLIIHSAEWTPAMKDQFGAASSEQQKRAILRKFGYGVPSFERAVLSAANDMTLIAEDRLRPFWKDQGRIKSREMNLHQLPWPATELQELGETEVELRLTLSYFVEPNPGERGWLRRHRYPSHALRFKVKHSLETVDDFRRRINAAAIAEEEGLPQNNLGRDNWFLGRLRDVGSVHSDYWRGTAAELARRSAVGIYPIGGWWKENPAHHRFEMDVRYALIVSIRALNGTVDIYSSVRTQVLSPIEIIT